MKINPAASCFPCRWALPTISLSGGTGFQPVNTRTTIGPAGLNYRVRDGIGGDTFRKAALALFFVIIIIMILRNYPQRTFSNTVQLNLGERSAF